MIAATFHFPQAELWAMDDKDLEFWLERAREINNPKQPR